MAGYRVPVSFGFSMLGNFFLGFFSPPMASLAQSLATPQMRSLAHAIWTMPFTLIGMGLGPFIVGMLSENWSQTYGVDSLRYGLVAITALLPVGALGFLLAARNLRADIARVSSRETTPPEST